MVFPGHDELIGPAAMNLNGKNQASGLINERGVALVMVLWIFTFLLVVAFDFSTSVRQEATAAHRYSDETQGYYLALAGFERGVYEFLQQGTNRETLGSQQQGDLF